MAYSSSFAEISNLETVKESKTRTTTIIILCLKIIVLILINMKSSAWSYGSEVDVTFFAKISILNLKICESKILKYFLLSSAKNCINIFCFLSTNIVVWFLSQKTAHY